jgi:hypothetical protein
MTRPQRGIEARCIEKNDGCSRRCQAARCAETRNASAHDHDGAVRVFPDLWRRLLHINSEPADGA